MKWCQSSTASLLLNDLNICSQMLLSYWIKEHKWPSSLNEVRVCFLKLFVFFRFLLNLAYKCKYLTSVTPCSHHFFHFWSYKWLIKTIIIIKSPHANILKVFGSYLICESSLTYALLNKLIILLYHFHFWRQLQESQSVTGKHGFRTRWTHQIMPRGGHAVPRDRPRQPYDELLQVASFKKKWHTHNLRRHGEVVRGWLTSESARFRTWPRLSKIC